LRVMTEALGRVPREEWRREVCMARDPQVLRVVQVVERHCEGKVAALGPAEVAQRVAGRAMSPEVRGMMGKVQSGAVNPKSVPGLLLAIMIKLSNPPQKEGREDRTMAEALSLVYEKQAEMAQEEMEDLMMKEKAMKAELKLTKEVS
jgi:hypothetical protein